MSCPGSVVICIISREPIALYYGVAREKPALAGEDAARVIEVTRCFSGLSMP